MNRKVFTLGMFVALSMMLFAGCGKAENNNSVTDRRLVSPGVEVTDAAGGEAIYTPEATESVTEDLENGAEDIKDGVEDAADGVGNAVDDAVNGAGDVAEDVIDGTKDAVDHTTDVIEDDDRAGHTDRKDDTRHVVGHEKKKSR